MTQPSSLDLEFNDHPVCPHCAHKERDAWEIDFGTSGTVTTWCGSCGQAYSVTEHVSTSYSTAMPRP